MIKPGPNYQIPQYIKRRLASIRDDHLRGEIRRLMIQANLASRVTVAHTKNDN
jgi:hypothetical protein